MSAEAQLSPAARALAIRVGATGSRVALREKRRGRWHDVSWDELATLVADQTTAPTRPLTSRAIARVLADGAIDAARLAAAESRVRARRLGPDDVALVIAPTVWADHELDLLAEWIVAGFTLALPETVESVGVDIREVRPTYVFAPARTFSAIAADTEARLPAPGTRRRRWLDRALASNSAFASSLVRTPLRRAIGWSRIRVAVTLDAPLDPSSAQFFAAIDAAVSGPGEPSRGVEPRVETPATIATATVVEGL